MRSSGAIGFSLAAVGLVLLGGPGSAGAHQTTLRTTLVPVLGGSSPIVLGVRGRAKLTLGVNKGGTVRFLLRNATDASGERITAAGSLRIEAVINGAAQTLEWPIEIERGKAKLSIKGLGLVKPDVIEVQEISLDDDQGTPFATLGVRILQGP